MASLYPQVGVAVPHSAPLNAKEHLRARPTPLLGRERETHIACRYLVDEEPPARLLTLTGPGGTGKTRLALEVAARLSERFEDGVVIVDLVPVTYAELVPSALARALDLPDTGDTPLIESLTRYLEHKRVLIVLDNFEHVCGAAPLLSQLLGACPGLTFLVTSRSRLRITWEQVLPVPPLEVPDLGQLATVDVLADVPAVALFLQRARAIDPEFALTGANARAVAELCVRLDGLPLALELAAARIDVLPPQSLVDRPLELLTDAAADVPVRHWTMRHAIGWSYELLSPEEQVLFRRLAILPAGCTPESATAVCADVDKSNGGVHSSAPNVQVLATLASLANKSLLRRAWQQEDQPRFGMLETIRAFALEQLLECGDFESTAHRFANFFVALAERAEPDLTGRDQGVRLDQLEREHGNIRAALRWCIDQRAAEEGLRLAASLWRFWFTRHLSEGDHWLSELLALEGSNVVQPPTRAKALNGAGNLAHARGDLDRATKLHEQSLTLRQEMADQRGIAISLNSLANVAVDRLDYEAARELHQRSLALRRELGDKRGIAVALNNLSVIERDQGMWPRAAELSSESAKIFRELGDEHGLALSLVTLGLAKYHLGSPLEATALHKEALALFRDLGDEREIAEWLEVLAKTAYTHGQLSQAVRLFGAAEGALEGMGSSKGPARAPRYGRYMAELRTKLGDTDFAEAWASGHAMLLEDAIAAAIAEQDVEASLSTPPNALDRRPKKGARAGYREATRANDAPDSLTRREQEVMPLLARGLTNRQIADELMISERTAETHVCTILKKLGFTRRAQLTAWAVRHDLQPSPLADLARG
jgi:predicted ATPase/DNA-binding CsgD family transcriptional regulator